MASPQDGLVIVGGIDRLCGGGLGHAATGFGRFHHVVQHRRTHLGTEVSGAEENGELEWIT